MDAGFKQVRACIRSQDYSCRKVWFRKAWFVKYTKCTIQERNRNMCKLCISQTQFLESSCSAIANTNQNVTCRVCLDRGAWPLSGGVDSTMGIWSLSFLHNYWSSPPTDRGAVSPGLRMRPDNRREPSQILFWIIHPSYVQTCSLHVTAFPKDNYSSTYSYWESKQQTRKLFKNVKSEW